MWVVWVSDGWRATTIGPFGNKKEAKDFAEFWFPKSNVNPMPYEVHEMVPPRDATENLGDFYKEEVVDSHEKSSSS